ncbi:hypothetical protein GCM10009844_32950 [Nocardioides koreensis]|uniref:Polyketide cyclase n=1 Tax=Nocardioides koreensis TaxID=433651 RepID=A0ABP5LP70_9ACTN
MAHQVNRIDYRGAFWFPVGPDELWRTIERFDRFESWWDWLRDFRTDSDALVAGNVLHATVVPPVPWRLSMDIRLERSQRPHLLEAVVAGDVGGSAVFRLEPDDDGTLVAVVWSLEMLSRPLRLAAIVAYPLMRWGHDRVVEMAVAGFRRRALDGSPT